MTLDDRLQSYHTTDACTRRTKRSAPTPGFSGALYVFELRGPPFELRGPPFELRGPPFELRGPPEHTVYCVLLL